MKSLKSRVAGQWGQPLEPAKESTDRLDLALPPREPGERRVVALRGLGHRDRRRRVLRNVPAVLYELVLESDGSLWFSFVSDSAYDLLEASHEQIETDADALLGRVHPADRTEFDRSLADSARELAPWHWQGRLILASGQVQWFSNSATPTGLSGDRVRWDGILTPVIAPAGVALAAPPVELSRDWQAITALVENDPDLIAIADLAGNLTHINPSGLKLLGLRDLATVMGQPIEDLFAPEDREILNDLIHPVALREGQWHGAFRMWHEERQVAIAVDYTAFVIRDPLSGQATNLGIFARDASDRQAVEWALRESELRLRQKTKDLERTLSELKSAQSHLVQQEKMSGLGQLVAGVAHEINNPVNFIYGNLDHAKAYVGDLLELVELYRAHIPEGTIPDIDERIEDIELDYLLEDLPKLLGSMKTGADRIKEIVRSLRLFSRMDESDMKDADLHEGIDSTLTILNNRLKARAEHPEIQVIKRYGNLPKIDCYPGQLNQVFMNLLANAIDALEDNLRTTDVPPRITIETEIDAAHERVHIRIADNGPGIPEPIRDRLFDPFFTTKAIGKGTGLGLSIAYQIITDKHHGRLSIESAPGCGAIFTIEIPTRQTSS